MNDRSQTAGKLRVVLPGILWEAVAAVVQQERQRAVATDPGSDLAAFLDRLQQALGEREPEQQAPEQQETAGPERAAVWGHEGGFGRLAELLLDVRQWSLGRALVEAVSHAVCGRSAAGRGDGGDSLPESVMQTARELAREMDEGRDRTVVAGRQPRQPKKSRGKKSETDSRQPSLF